ncbi:MAG: type II toxin-antitoxin system VapC family toxin [Clostridia bacterium]|nr:type II toxin-antitoxin system VapC family toxin [Clostridia bacterium]
MLLLDTHVFLWFVNGDEKLPQSMMRDIQTEDKVYISIVSFWEMAIKSSLGKLSLPCSISKLMEDCEKMNINVLHISAVHLEQLKSLPWVHRDPFDRLIICQAQTEGLKLATVDENIKKYSVETME